MGKPEYHEGKEAQERFEKLASKVFQAPKTVVSAPAKPTPKKPG